MGGIALFRIAKNSYSRRPVPEALSRLAGGTIDVALFVSRLTWALTTNSRVGILRNGEQWMYGKSSSSSKQAGVKLAYQPRFSVSLSATERARPGHVRLSTLFQPRPDSLPQPVKTHPPSTPPHLTPSPLPLLPSRRLLSGLFSLILDNATGHVVDQSHHDKTIALQYCSSVIFRLEIRAEILRPPASVYRSPAHSVPMANVPTANHTTRH